VSSKKLGVLYIVPTGDETTTTKQSKRVKKKARIGSKKSNTIIKHQINKIQIKVSEKSIFSA